MDINIVILSLCLHNLSTLHVLVYKTRLRNLLQNGFKKIFVVGQNYNANNAGTDDY